MLKIIKIKRIRSKKWTDVTSFLVSESILKSLNAILPHEAIPGEYLPVSLDKLKELGEFYCINEIAELNNSNEKFDRYMLTLINKRK